MLITLMMLFWGIVLAFRVGCQDADNKRFEKRCLENHSDRTFNFVDFLDPLFLICLPLPFLIYYYIGMSALLLLAGAYFAGQALLWSVAMFRYSNRPTESKKTNWKCKYCLWISGHGMALAAIMICWVNIYFENRGAE